MNRSDESLLLRNNEFADMRYIIVKMVLHTDTFDVVIVI